MNVELRRPMTVQEYLAWADSQAERQRTELINGQVVAMSPERSRSQSYQAAGVHGS